MNLIAETAVAGRRAESGTPGVFEKLLLREFAPASVIVSERGEINYIHGRTGNYLEPASGHPRLNVLEMAREGLRFELDTLLRQARNPEGNAVHRKVRVKTNEGFTLVNVSARRIAEPGEPFDLELAVEEDRRNRRAVEQVLHVVVGLRKEFDLVL